MPELGPEDEKLLTLARMSRARNGAAEGAAVRDGMGRTYAAATVSLPSLPLSALRLAVAMAASSGASTLEAAAVVADQTTAGPDTAAAVRADDAAAVRDEDAAVRADDAAAVRDLAGSGVPVYVADPDGAVRAIVRT
jgi:hypothetical protein